ncbi:iron-sulfur cluster repair di-iron protein [Paracoccus binzhouensis]|uniref:iron-sulfur cluster repair di-iron protein n=1 Tax=Paracoccus binzhouensis TaxID=2796149 RepID=UPI0018EECAE0|nr:iron-sulfur cluster repair di-iron protein [Paracoccus binzhouensis]
MTDTLLDPENTVRDIAAKLPGAAGIFRDADISFCCGGELSLADAARKAGLDLAALTARLQALIDRAAQDAPADTAGLIAHILDRYHATHREELAFLIQLANRVEMVHGDHDEAPLGLTEALILLQGELDAHMTKEEKVLFPAILQGIGATLAGPIQVMQQDHADTSELLRRIEHVTNGLRLPVGACGSWTALYTGLRKLCDDVVAHIHLEETILFPRALAA